MIQCPYCDAENIPGSEVCAHCGQTLTDVEQLVPATEVERSLLKDRLDVLEPSKPVVSVEPDVPVREVINLLAGRAIGCVLIVKEGRVVGIFSERDALCKVGTRAKELGDHPVSEFMTPKPQTLDRKSKVAFAVHRMDLGSYRHVPIVDEDDYPTAIVSVRDILKYLTAKMAS
jgi:CBS domain-containing protein